MLERYLIPLAPYFLASAGIFAWIYLFCSLKREIQGLKARLSRREAEIASASASTRNEMEEIRAQFRDAEERTAQLVPPPPVRSGLNINSRTQAIRMFRHGETAQDIAAKLGLPSYEVRLMLKVHELAANGSPAPAVVTAGVRSDDLPLPTSSQAAS